MTTLAESETISLNSEMAISTPLRTNSTLLDFDRHNYENTEYFSIKRLLKKTFYHQNGYLTKFLKEKCKLFHRPGENNLSPFENYLVSDDDNSAIISLIIRNFNLWGDETFWRTTVNLEQVMMYFADDGTANIKNLFSILLYDWHRPPAVSSQHALCEKFNAYAATGKSLFTKLFQIIDDPRCKGYEHICLRIIYQYLSERKMNLIEIGNYYERTVFQEEIYPVIGTALKLKNEDYKIQILKILIVFTDNTNDEHYSELKDKILDTVSYHFETNSVYKVNYDSIEKYCDEKYFKLAFLLKENRLKRFEFEFEEFIQMYKKLYGEYWKSAIKLNARLLHHIGEDNCEKKLLKTIEFIFKKCSFIELNSTILTNLDELSEFYVIFNEPLDKHEEKVLNSVYELLSKKIIDYEEFMKQFIHNKAFTRKLLLGRRSVQDKSLLERILSDSRLDRCLEVIWNRFNLHEKAELISIKNPLGKLIMEYVCQAGVNQIVAYLLLPNNQQGSNPHIKFNKQKYYTIVQNSQIYSITNKSILEYHVDIVLSHKEDYVNIFFLVIYFLEEIGTINNIKNDEVIDSFLNLMTQANEYSEELYELDDLLGIMVIYWTPDQKEYSAYKQKLVECSPFFRLLFLIIEKKQEEFFEKFQIEFDKLEEMYENRYDISITQRESNEHKYELYSSNFMFVLFLAAIRTNQHKIIDFIFKNDSFVTIEFGFPENVEPTEIHYYAALNLLKHGHELGRPNIPNDWLTKEVLEEFLDSRIIYRDQELIEINCSCFLHAETQKTKIKGSSDLSDKILMMDDTTALQFIKENENLKHLITHPVVEAYINLKSFKYQRIFVYNFWAFVILYILPITALLFNNHVPDSANSVWISWIKPELHYIGIIFLITRESFQGMISGSFWAYIKQQSNIFDVFLIFLSIAISVYSSVDSKPSMYKNLLEVSLILFTTICATSLLPLSFVPINMQILKKVSMTFMKIIYTFAIILIAFSFSFCIIFEDYFKNIKSQNGTDVKECNCNASEQEEYEKIEGIESFEKPHTSFLKILIMLSGEYSIDPAGLKSTQLAFFGFFVVSSFILFNLILGLSIEDVQELKTGSRQFNLITKAKKLINVGEKLFVFFSQYLEFNEQRHLEQDSQKSLRIKLMDTAVVIVRFFLSKYIHVHTIKKIYIDLKTKNVYTDVNRKYEHILAQNGSNGKGEYKIDNLMLEKIHKIINVKNRKMFKKLKQTMQLEETKQSRRD